MLSSLHREEDDSGDLEGPTWLTWGNPRSKLSHALRRAPNEVWYHKGRGLFGPPKPPDSRFGQLLPKHLIERPQFSNLLPNPALHSFPKLLPTSTRLPPISYYIPYLAHSDPRQDPEFPHLPAPKTLASAALLNVSLGSGSSLAWNRLKKSGALPQKERELSLSYSQKSPGPLVPSPVNHTSGTSPSGLTHRCISALVPW